MKTKGSILNNIAKVFIILELVSIGWLCGGTRVQYMMIMTTIAVLSFLVVVYGKLSSPQRDVLVSKYELYAYFISILFLLYVFIQSINIKVLKTPADGYSLYENMEYCSFLPYCTYESFSDFNNNAYFALYLGLICFGFACYSSLKDLKFTKISIGCFLLSSFVMGGFAIWQKVNYVIMYDRFFSTGDFYGTFFLKNAAGAFFCIGIIVALLCLFIPLKNNTQKLLCGLLVLPISVFLSYNVYNTKSEGAFLFCGVVWVGFFILLLFCLLRASRYRKFILTSALLLFSATATFCVLKYSKENISSDIFTSLNARININKNNIEIFKNHLMYGMGTSCYDYNLHKIINKKEDYTNNCKYIDIYDPHNSIIAYFVRHGIVGGLTISSLFILWIVLFFKKKMFLRSENMFIFWGVISCMMYALIDMHLSSIPSTMFAFVFLIALSLSNLRKADT